MDCNRLGNEPPRPVLSDLHQVRLSLIPGLLAQPPATVAAHLDLDDLPLNVFQSGVDESGVFSSTVTDCDEQGSFAAMSGSSVSHSASALGDLKKKTKEGQGEH